MYAETFSVLDRNFYICKIQEELDTIRHEIDSNKKSIVIINRSIKQYKFLSTETIDNMKRYRRKLRDNIRRLESKYDLYLDDLHKLEIHD